MGAAWAVGTAAVLLAYPLWFALRGPGSIRGAIQLVPQGYRADLLGPPGARLPAAAGPHHLASVADHFANSVTENGSYLGITLLAVLAVGTVVWWRESVVVRVAAITGMVAFVISLGAGLVVKADPPGPGQWVPASRASLHQAARPGQHHPGPLLAVHGALFAALLLAVILDRIHAALARRRLRPHRDPVRAAP